MPICTTASVKNFSLWDCKPFLNVSISDLFPELLSFVHEFLYPGYKKKKKEEENRMVMVILFNMRKICMMKLPDCKAKWSKERLLPSFTIEQRVHYHMLWINCYWQGLFWSNKRIVLELQTAGKIWWIWVLTFYSG